MFSALLNIVIPVFAVVGLGALYGRLRPGGALGYVNCNRPLRMKKPGAAESKWDLVGQNQG